MDDIFYQIGRLTVAIMICVLVGGLWEFGKALCRKLFNLKAD